MPGHGFSWLMVFGLAPGRKGEQIITVPTAVNWGTVGVSSGSWNFLIPFFIVLIIDDDEVWLL